MKNKKSATDNQWFPIVGIGASAGGLDAISRLLAALPDDTGMAFVVIQHLDPVRESLLPQILQRATPMPVTHAEDAMRILPDHVYIIPPGVHMSVKTGKLELHPRPEGVLAVAVDYFLTSLAEDRGNNAIAVILSGTANDGSAGVKAIKSEGGIVFAQDEASAAHGGMPHSAAATGTVDYILPPEKIAAELARIARHPVSSNQLSAPFDDAKSLGQIFLTLRRATGVDFGLYKPSTIQRRIMRRLVLLRLKRLNQYASLLVKNPDEVRALHDDLLIHVTRFFREAPALEALRTKAFPRLLKGLGPDTPIRVWIPGCSTGEEVYSLAMLLLDFLSEKDCMNPLQLFATDISETSLEKARAGVYSADIETDIPPRLLRRFFTKADPGYEIVKRVRDLCIFAKHDLTKDPPFANVDLISCCNVLIYLGADAQRRILPVFHYALRKDGALVMSNAETVGEFTQLFTVADKKSHLYFKKPAATKIHFTPSAIRTIDVSPPPRVKANPQGTWPETDVQKVADRILLTRFAPAGVIINGSLEILNFRGNVNRYIQPATGKASLSLLKMMPPHTASPLKALVEKARKTDAPAKALGMELGGDGSKHERFTLEVVPFRLPISGERYYILLFEEEAALTARTKAMRAGDAVSAGPRERITVKRLRGELESTRGYLQTIVEEHEAANEELKSANEEITSSNEELQSTNEELEIAKEELQAANEELNTLNEELQTRNADLGVLNDDLTNLLASVQLPIVMVSTDLRIRRFTPMAHSVMNLIPGDIGRPIGDLNSKIPLADIDKIIHEVIETATTRKLKVSAQRGRSYTVRVRPYKTADNKIVGAVLIFTLNEPAK
jgi:two-component system CheB/CheR fusion protein